MRPASSPPDEPFFSSAPAVPSAARLSVLISSLVTALGATAAGPTLALTSPVVPNVASQPVASQPADSMKIVDNLLAKSPNDASLRFRKGLLLAEQKRSAEAITVFRKLADDFPLLPEPQNNLAVLYAERGEPDKARAALEAALRSRPTYDTIYRNLGSVNARLAGAAYARALNIDESKSAAVRLALIPVWAGADAMAPMVLAAAPAPAPAPAPVVAVAPPPVAKAVPTPTPAPAPVASVPAKVVVAAAPIAAPAAAPAPTSVPAVKPPSVVVPASAPMVVAAAKPAPAPAPAPAPTPTTAPAPVASKPTPAPAVAAVAPAARTAAEEAAVRKAVQDWARAWSNKQTDTYIATYAPGFSGGEGSASAWQAARRVRITGKKDIDVGVSDLKLRGDKTKWSATFTQSYSADSLSLVSRKTLDFELRGGRWLIVRENNGKGR